MASAQILHSQFKQKLSAFFEGLEGVFFGDYVGDDVERFEHIERLGLDDGHEDGDAAGLEVFDGGLHGVEARLVHEAHELHSYDDDFGVVGHVLHHLFEFVDGAEEDRTVQTLHVDVLAHLVGEAAFVIPWDVFVEVGDAWVG